MAGSLGAIRQIRCEWSFPLGSVFALENGVSPEGSDWYDLLQAIACQTADVCLRWLGRALSVSEDLVHQFIIRRGWSTMHRRG